jgi:hypothetical protein
MLHRIVSNSRATYYRILQNIKTCRCTVRVMCVHIHVHHMYMYTYFIMIERGLDLRKCANVFAARDLSSLISKDATASRPVIRLMRNVFCKLLRPIYLYIRVRNIGNVV